MEKHSFEKDRFKEISIHLDDGQSLYALINGDFGWLMYLRYDGDAGFSSRNPQFRGSNDEVMEFLLSNGQLDEYPLSWVIPIEIINNALSYFEAAKEQPPFITWYDDSI